MGSSPLSVSHFSPDKHTKAELVPGSHPYSRPCRHHDMLPTTTLVKHSLWPSPSERCGQACHAVSMFLPFGQNPFRIGKISAQNPQNNEQILLWMAGASRLRRRLSKLLDLARSDFHSNGLATDTPLLRLPIRPGAGEKMTDDRVQTPQEYLRRKARVRQNQEPLRFNPKRVR
jgi:hypothetical protein